MKKILFILLSTIFIFSSCKSYSDKEKSKFDTEIQAYLKKKQLDCVHSPSGLYYKIINPGEGKNIRYQDIVSFTYTGSFLSGKQFDKQLKPVEFPVKELIAGWKEIMLELKPGGKAFVVIPPQLGYGKHKLADIPANSILVYELEIDSVK